MAKQPVNGTVPKFASEAEEAQWWFENRGKYAKEFVHALQSGTAKRLTKEALQEQIEASKATHMRFSAADLRLARELASSKGLPYQTYIKSLLHEALQREARRR